jgi:hypothetical protein
VINRVRTHAGDPIRKKGNEKGEGKRESEEADAGSAMSEHHA